MILKSDVDSINIALLGSFYKEMLLRQLTFAEIPLIPFLAHFWHTVNEKVSFLLLPLLTNINIIEFLHKVDTPMIAEGTFGNWRPTTTESLPRGIQLIL